MRLLLYRESAGAGPNSDVMGLTPIQTQRTQAVAGPFRGMCPISHRRESGGIIAEGEGHSGRPLSLDPREKSVPFWTVAESGMQYSAEAGFFSNFGQSTRQRSLSSALMEDSVVSDRPLDSEICGGEDHSVTRKSAGISLTDSV